MVLIKDLPPGTMIKGKDWNAVIVAKLPNGDVKAAQINEPEIPDYCCGIHYADDEVEVIPSKVRGGEIWLLGDLPDGAVFQMMSGFPSSRFIKIDAFSPTVRAYMLGVYSLSFVFHVGFRVRGIRVTSPDGEAQS